MKDFRTTYRQKLDMRSQVMKEQMVIRDEFELDNLGGFYRIFPPESEELMPCYN